MSAEKNKRLELFLADEARQDIAYWRSNNAAIAERIDTILENCRDTPFQGVGKPEPLKYELSGMWSRRINREHRIVYRVALDTVFVLSCCYHYQKK